MTIFTANPRVKCDLQHNIAHIVAAKGGIGQVPATSGYQGQTGIGRSIGDADPGQASGRMYGNSSTSRIEAESVNSITRRSMPTPSPPVGGKPTSSARM